MRLPFRAGETEESSDEAVRFFFFILLLGVAFLEKLSRCDGEALVITIGDLLLSVRLM